MESLHHGGHGTGVKSMLIGGDHHHGKNEVECFVKWPERRFCKTDLPRRKQILDGTRE